MRYGAVFYRFSQLEIHGINPDAGNGAEQI
jgi:hypothetical protein